MNARAKAKDGTGITGSLAITLSNQAFPTSSPSHETETGIYCHNRTLYIHSDELVEQQCQLKIYDLSGRMLVQEQINPTSYTYDLSHLHGGIYIIRLSQPDWDELYKISIY